MNKRTFAFFALFLLIGTTFASSFAVAQTTRTFSGTTSASYFNPQRAPSFQAYYGSNIDTYWPVLGDQATCEARQDLLLNVAPAGCQPTVVRSDLLAEQNVPVFCQIDALKINPLIDVEQIRNIRFQGDFPPEVVGTGFHPARAALRTDNRLLGSPTINNLGYVVVVLRREPDESRLPDSISIPLSANIDYVSGNAYGVGKSEFILEKVSESEWEREKLKQSFWNGRYFVRLEDADSNFAEVSIYEGDQKFTTLRVNRNEPSREIFVPGYYCRAGLQVAYDGFVSAENKARIEVSSGNNVDTFDVYEGSRFLDDRCFIRRIDITNSTGIGTVTGNCRGEEFVLQLKTRKTSEVGEITVQGEKQEVKEIGNEYEVSLPSGRYRLDNQDKLIKWTNGKADTLINSTGYINETLVSAQDIGWITQLKQDLDQYKSARQGNPGRSLTDREISTETKRYFDNAINSYEEVADDYPNEANDEVGKEALVRAINLAGDFGKDNTKIRLINKLTEIYPDTPESATYTEQLNRMFEIDSSLSGEAIQFDDKVRTIRLISISEPIEKASADLIVENNRINIELRETKDLRHSNEIQGKITLDNVNPEEIELSARCMETDSSSNRRVSSNIERYRIRLNGPAQPICGLNVRLAEANTKKVAKIRIIPKVEGTQTITDFTVNIGIEKRAIQLTPDKTRERIENINKSVKKWEDISEKLGKVVTGLKTACFATSALLTFKNFISGMGGESLARQEVMGGDNGWRNWCKEHSGTNNQYISLDSCFLENAGKIDADVAKTTSAINKANQRIQAVQNKYKTSDGFFGESVNTEKMRADLAEEIKQMYPGATINMGNKVWVDGDTELKDVPIEKLLTPENIKNNQITTDGMRSLMLNLELQKQGGLSSEIGTNPNLRLIDIAQRTHENMRSYQEFEKAKSLKTQGYPSPLYVSSTNQERRFADVVRLTPKLREETGFTDPSITHVAMVNANPGAAKLSQEAEKFGQGTYFLGLTGDTQRNIFSVQNVVKQGNKSIVYTGKDAAGFTEAYGIGNIKSLESLSYRNEIDQTSRQCSYYETEPYNGMPAVVPFDYQNGWYAATKQTLPVFGGIGAFDASGRVTSFWLCNVGDNGRVEFESGFGDDLCQQINLQTGQPLGIFPGLSETDAKNKISQAVRAIQDAANQHGNKYITVAGERCEVGMPSTGQAGTQCQDFMSPTDCNLMFNVCDPVICPSSRCDFGGQYHVANVVQSGIIGSALLCLPNFREKIIIPVCLTGIQAGIDGLVSIMRNHRDCLQESLNTGEMVGICDQIYSIYLCEFFWNQFAPLINVLIPKLFEMTYGQGVRGGGEYLTVQSAWQNMGKSIDYFTQSYAVNSIEAFQARSVDEVGGQFCKAFVSAKAPTAFETLVAPDSPPQFHAWFDAKRYSDATVPATSQYKVFYHIFAGKDQGVSFNVYLKNPPESSYYLTAPYVQVDSGFIPRGEYASETRDFTAPEGYKELCVRINNEEECGFGQVSTSFALDYLKDIYAKDQIETAHITSEKECIGGTPNPAALLTPNIQQGVEETINPEIYNRGITRICSTQNPGLSTNPQRFVDSGYCDNEKVRCWLDKESVNNAITAGNIGLINSTLENLDQRTKDYLESSGEVYTPSEAEKEIHDLKSAFASLEKKTGDRRSDADSISNRVDSILSKLFYGLYKAEALLVKGKANELVARDLIIVDDNARRQNRATTQPTEEITPPSTNTGDNSENDANTNSETNRCEECGDGVFNLCDREECQNLGSCYFEVGTFTDSCHSCAEVTSCLEYNDETLCNEDMCGQSSCKWSNSGELCFNMNNNVLEGKIPCRDSEGRLKIDFGGSTGSYGFINNKLQFWTGSWTDAIGNGVPDWSTKSNTEKERLLQMEEGFRGLSQSPTIQNCGTDGSNDNSGTEEPKYKLNGDKIFYGADDTQISTDGIAVYLENYAEIGLEGPNVASITDGKINVYNYLRRKIREKINTIESAKHLLYLHGKQYSELQGSGIPYTGGEQELTFEEKFSIEEIGDRFLIKYSGDNTGLFIKKNTRVLSYQSLENRAGSINRKVDPLNSGDKSFISIGDSSIAILNRFSITALNGAEILRNSDGSLEITLQ